MATDTARWIEALDRQSSIVLAIFAGAGFEPIAPPIIQPADVFLDLVGEELRGRTYVFADPSGAELCLRPDLTVPTCRHYVERHGHDGAPASYAYNGVIFRHQETPGDAARPREFRQTGIESFGAPDPIRADAETAAIVVEGVRASRLRSFRLRLGDIGLIHALLDAIDMPERWRVDLQHHFWRPAAFRQYLRRLGRPQDAARAIPPTLAARLDPQRPDEAATIVAEHLESAGLTATGTRTTEEIAEHLLGLIADARATPLPGNVAQMLEDYLAIRVPAQDATSHIGKLLARHKIDIGEALSRFDLRLSLLAQEGVDVGSAEFGGGFGRSFDYYTGFVFEVVAPALPETAAVVAGGGRYDGIVAAVGAGRAVPAVGAAIHNERLLLAVRGGRQ